MNRLAVVAAMLVGLSGWWAPPSASAAWNEPATGAAGAAAATLNAGKAASAATTASTVDLSWAASTTSNGAPASGYVIKRYDSTGTVQQTITSGSCGGLVPGTSCSETAVPDGRWTYAVTPAYGSWRGAAGPQTSVVVDTGAPTNAITFPVSGSSYHGSGYASGCGTASLGDVCGAADDGGSGVAGVQVSIKQEGTGTYWNGTGFISTSEVLLNATGTSNWSYPLATASFPADGAYTLRVRVADNIANVSSTTSTFTIDRTAPVAPTISSAPANPSNSADASFEFSHTEPTAGFECRLDGSNFTSCTSPQGYTNLAEGSHAFDVRAFDDAGNRSVVASRTWAIDTSAPAVAITFPTSGTPYNGSGFTAGCASASSGDFCGTASDSGSGVATVEISLRQGSGSYWAGTGFSSNAERWFTGTGTAAWSYPFNAANFPADGQYTLRARATDASGNSTITSATFTIDRTAPIPVNIEATNGSGGTLARVEQGDRVTFTFSETMAPTSILAGWNGASTNVVVRLNDGGPANDTLTVRDASNIAQLPFGTINLGRTDYTDRNHTFGAAGTTSAMVQNGASITVSLGSRSGGPTSPTAAGPGSLIWTPTSAATDSAGNHVTSTALSEPGALDRDF